MRLPLTWLTDYVDIDLAVDDLAHRLTMAGLKVEAIDRIGQDWDDVYIGEVVAIEPHPTSRKPLHVAQVSLGDRTVEVVTGAQNVRQGEKAPIVLIGGVLPHGPEGGPLRIEARPMAGITSQGMLASARELGISEEHSGIYILPAEAPVGAALRSFMGDDVLDIETNPNRPDTLSVVGNAREVAAVTEQQLSLPDLEAITGPVEWLDDESIPIEVEAPELCPRYTALRIEGVTTRPSPFWLARRLEEAGMRPINLLVDLTNYVMLEYGQPMHAFDAARLSGGRIVVRRARPGESIVTLDGVERQLTPDDLVIADAQRAVGIAGVMGGEASEVTDETRDIILESATFDPVIVRRTAKKLGLRTEASARFEKGLPVETALLAQQRFLQLLAQIVEQPVHVARLADVSVPPPAPPVVRLPMRDLSRLLGMNVPVDRAAEALSLLGFEVEVEGEALVATVPFWRRVDIQESADLVEEVARLVGYGEIPTTLFTRTMEARPLLPALRREEVARERLLAAGASEVTTGSLTSDRSLARLFRPGTEAALEDGQRWAGVVPNAAAVFEHEALAVPVRLLNPPSQDRCELRLLLLPSVLDVVARNIKHSDEQLAFFELANTYFARPENLPYERRTLAVALSGNRTPHAWQQPSPGPYTFFDVKGMLESVAAALQVKGIEFEPINHPALHPGRGAALRLAGHDVGYLGELHPRVAEQFEIEGWPVQVAEVDLEALLAAASDERVYEPIPRFPSARRDIAVLVRDDVRAGDVLDVVRDAGGQLLARARIFDVYAGDPLPPGQKSVAVSMELQAPGATLAPHEIGEVMERIVDALDRRLGATLRE